MNLYEELGRVGAEATAESGRRLGSSDVRDALEARVRRGRRTRALGGTGVVAGVTVVAVGLWSVSPGLGGIGDPAGTGPSMYAGPVPDTEFTVDGSAPVDAHYGIDLNDHDSFACGALVDLTEGVVVHDSSVIDRGVTVAAQSWVGPPATEFADGDEGSAAERWSSAYASEPVTVDTGRNEQFFTYAATWEEGRDITLIQVPLVLGGNEVVGTWVTTGTPQGTGPGSWEPERLLPVLPGDCRGVETADGADGVYEPVLVTQILDDTDVRPLATIVVSGGEHEYVGLGGAVREPASDGQALLRDFDGPTYQAFVVPEPEPGCAPLAELLAAGQPGRDAVEYQVEVPGVAGTLTGALWGSEPVAVLPDGEEPWYVGRDAWLLADDVSDGIEDPHLQWTSLSVGGWALSVVGGPGPASPDPLRGPNCAYNQPIPEISGAVFLVIDGVDMEAVEDAAPGVSWAVDPSELQTWVFLGTAESA